MITYPILQLHPHDHRGKLSIHFDNTINNVSFVFLDQNLTLADLTTGRPETARLVQLAPHIPVAVEVLLNSLINSPDKVSCPSVGVL